MVDVTIDDLGTESTLTLENIIHFKDIGTGGDNDDKYITIEDFLGNIITLLSSFPMAYARDDYFALQDNTTGETYKINFGDLVDKLHTVLNASTAIDGSSTLVWSDGTDTFEGNAPDIIEGLLPLITTSTTLASSDYVVISQGGSGKIETVANFADNLLKNVSGTLTSHDSTDKIAVVDVSDSNKTKLQTSVNLFNSGLQHLPTASPVSFGASDRVPYIASGAASRVTVKDVLEKGPDDLLSALVAADSSDAALIVDATDGLTKLATLPDLVTAVLGGGINFTSTDVLSGSTLETVEAGSIKISNFLITFGKWEINYGGLNTQRSVIFSNLGLPDFNSNNYTIITGSSPSGYNTTSWRFPTASGFSLETAFVSGASQAEYLTFICIGQAA